MTAILGETGCRSGLDEIRFRDVADARGLEPEIARGLEVGLAHATGADEEETLGHLFRDLMIGRSVSRLDAVSTARIDDV